MRAKFLCNNVVSEGEGESKYESISLHAVYSSDKNEEDNQFSKATPWGEYRMTVTNPKAFGFFKPQKKYYLDFTEVEE